MMINWIRRLFQKPEIKKPVFRFKDGQFLSSYVPYDRACHPGMVAQHAAIWECANNGSPFDNFPGLGYHGLRVGNSNAQRLYNFEMSKMAERAALGSTNWWNS